MTRSPLSLVVQDEKVNLLLDNLRKSVQENRELLLKSEDIQYIKNTFQEGIQNGEKGLHELSFQMIRWFGDLADTKVTLIVWGRCPIKEHSEINKSYTNIELGQVMSAKYMDSIAAWSHSPICKICNQKTNTIASFNQYRLEKDYPSGLKLLLSRIKTTSNICYKIADMVFDIDRMFERDKIVNTYTQTIMDVYGLKIAFQKKENIFHALEHLKEQENIEIIDEKNYLDEKKKKSGYEAYKVSFRQNHQIFEIQFQTLDMLNVEKSSYRAGHRTYKEKQMEDRQKMGSAYRNFYDVLIQAFSQSTSPIDYKE